MVLRGGLAAPTAAGRRGGWVGWRAAISLKTGARWRGCRLDVPVLGDRAGDIDVTVEQGRRTMAPARRVGGKRCCRPACRVGGLGPR